MYFSTFLFILLVILSVVIATIFVELGVAFLFKIRGKKSRKAIIVINLITNPLANIFVGIYSMGFSPFVILIEIVVVLVEWWLLVYSLRLNENKAFWLSLVMNFASFVVGVLLMILSVVVISIIL